LEGSHAFLFCPSDTSNIWMKKGMAHRWSGSDREKQKLRGNPVPVPICLPQTSQELDRTEASAVRGRRLSVLVVRKYYNDILGSSSYLAENRLRLKKDQSVNDV
jgi:hypothetical protein